MSLLLKLESQALKLMSITEEFCISPKLTTPIVLKKKKNPSMVRLEIDTSEVDEESDNQLPLLLSVDIKLPSSFKTGKPRPANPITEERN